MNLDDAVRFCFLKAGDTFIYANKVYKKIYDDTAEDEDGIYEIFTNVKELVYPVEI